MEASHVPPSSPSDAETTRTALNALIGEAHLRPTLPADHVDGVVPEFIAEPGNAGELAAILKIARETRRCVIPRGSGSKPRWGNPPKAAHLVLSTLRLNKVLEHAWGDMTATVEAGCVFADFQRALAEHGQRLALEPLWPERATVGGTLATNDSGALRTRFGSLRDLVIGVTLALPDGSLAKSGGKVVKNVAGYDLAKLATGSLGTLGVITQAIFRLHPVPHHTRSISLSFQDSRELTTAMLSILDSQLIPSGVQIRAASASPPSIDILFEGTAQGCDAQVQHVDSIVTGCSADESDASVWRAREPLFEESPNAAVCKVSLLPAEFGRLLGDLARQSQALSFSWTLVAQAIGIGLLRLEAVSIDGLRQAVLDLRTKLESSGGSLVVLDCPRELKNFLDAWGSPGDALPLMKSIKTQFDPAGVLNPGRFVGSI